MLKIKIKAFFLHGVLSFLIGSLAAYCVFYFWYPSPFDELSGGREIFLLIAAVDVIVGPLITFVVFNPKKKRLEKFFDLGFIIFLQTIALVYGLWSASQAKPIYVVFEYDRLRVVHVSDLPLDGRENIYSKLKSFSIQRPQYLSLRALEPAEQLELTIAALEGIPLAARSQLWRPYEDAKKEIIDKSGFLSDLKTNHPEKERIIDELVWKSKVPENRLRYLPIFSRKAIWTAVIDINGLLPVGFIELDPT